MIDILKGSAAAHRRRVPFYAVDGNGDPVEGLTGTPLLCYNGGAPTAVGSNAAVETGDGWYYVDLTDANITLGDHIRVSGFSSAQYVFGDARVVAVDVAVAPPTLTQLAEAIWNLVPAALTAVPNLTTSTMGERVRWLFAALTHRLVGSTSNSKQTLYRADGTTPLADVPLTETQSTFTRGAPTNPS